MKNYRVLTIFILLVCLISKSSTAQETPTTSPGKNGMSIDTLVKMNAHFHRLVDEKQLAGIQTAILRHGELIHFDTYGYSNIEKEKKLDQGSLFRIFSMTKPIVSVALMQLFEEGKFELEDPLHKFIPAFKEMKIYSDSMLIPATKSIRILDLLRHTSGFSYGRTSHPKLTQLYTDADLNSSKNNKEFVEKLSKLPLQFEPGTDYQYGLSTNICGYLIEVLSGKPLDLYLQEHIFTPLEMNDTHFQLPKEKIDRFTVGYGWNEEAGLIVFETETENRYVEEVTLFNGGGGLVSSTFDYLKFAQMVLNKGTLNDHQFLKEETIDLMLKDHLQEPRTYQERLRLIPGEAGFGLGFAVRGPNENELSNVFGWGGAVGTYFKVDTDHDLVYVMMIQISPYRHLGLRDLFHNYVQSSIID